MAPDVSFDLTGKAAVVTGASSGMGREIAAALSHAGARVTLVGRDRARLGETDALAGGGCEIVPIELTDATAPAAVIERTLHAFGKVDVLVHAAGLFLPLPFAESSLDDLDRQWQINVRVPYALTRAALPHLCSGASVIFISSIAGHIGFPNSAGYCATKGGIELLSKALSLELASRGIRFNCIAPGNVRTPMNAHLLSDPEYERAMLDATPAGRIGTVADIAAAALYLASDAASYVHGTSLVIDGGWTAG